MCCTMNVFDKYYMPHEIIINCIQVAVSVVVWLRLGDCCFYFCTGRTHINITLSDDFNVVVES